MKYPTTNRTALIFTGSIADLSNFESELTSFVEKNRHNNNALLIMINSYGGINEHVFALCALIRWVRSQGHQVCIHVLGQLCHYTYLIGCAADLLAMEPYASLVFGQPTVSVKDSSIGKVLNEIERQTQHNDQLVKAIVKRSKGKLSEATVRSWRAKHITAQQALEWGLCDMVHELPKPQPKSDKSEKTFLFIGSFTKEDEVFKKLIEINLWLEDPANLNRPIRVIITSHGGTVAQALTLYGLLLEAQRQGHYLTLHIAGQCYSCALWFTTCALGSGTVEWDVDAKGMFHPPWVMSMEGPLDEMMDLLSVETGVYHQTRAMLQRAAGFTEERLAEWEKGPDHFFAAKELVEMGLGVLVGDED